MRRNDQSPVLWHILISHYSEKVRWALDHKRIPHRRRAVAPPAHMAVAYILTGGRGYTLPVMRIGGETYGDSTAIIAALEHLHPEAPLYPSDPALRRRALALETFFDEELGPYARLLGFHELRADEDAMARVAGAMLPGELGRSERLAAVAGRVGRSYAAIRYRADSEVEAGVARRRIVAALDRLEAELDGGAGDFLVGDRFTVADLTAASLFYPLVRPPEAFALPEPPPRYERFIASVQGRRGFAWVSETFARHRGVTRA